MAKQAGAISRRSSLRAFPGRSKEGVVIEKSALPDIPGFSERTADRGVSAVKKDKGG
jgi:hypothetical protein